MVYNNYYVTSYNPYLLKTFNYHLNVKSYVGFKAIKYVYKYVYKGLDYVVLKVTSEASLLGDV